MTLQELLSNAKTNNISVTTGSSSKGPTTLKDLLSGAKTTNAPVFTENPTQTMQSPSARIGADYRAGKINAGDVVLQGVGEAAKQTNEALLSRWSPLGWVNDALQGAAGVVGAGISAAAKPLGTFAGSTLRSIVGSGKADAVAKKIVDIVNTPFAQGLIKTYDNPQVKGDLGAFGNVATLAGTMVAAGEGAKAMSGVGSAVQPLAKSLQENATAGATEQAAAAEKADWSAPAKTTRGFLKAQGVLDNAQSRGIDVPDVLVKNRISIADNVENGKYATADTAAQLREDAATMSRQVLRPSLQMADYTTPKTSVQDIIDRTISDIKTNKTLTADDMEAQIAQAEKKGQALTRRYPDGMSLTDMHDEKINYTNNRYSPIGPKSDTNAAAVDRSFGRTLAGTVEDKAPAGIPVKEFNAELAKQFQAADYLDQLNGKTVPKTIAAKIRGYIGKAVGAGAGNALGAGILGDVAGYHIGGMVENMLETLPDSIRGHLLNNLEMTNPEAFQAVRQYMGEEMTGRLQRRLLPAPNSDTPIPMPAYKGGESGFNPARTQAFADERAAIQKTNSEDISASDAQKSRDQYVADQQSEAKAIQELRQRMSQQDYRSQIEQFSKRFRTFDSWMKFVNSNPALLKKIQSIGASPEAIWDIMSQ